MDKLKLITKTSQFKIGMLAALAVLLVGSLITNIWFWTELNKTKQTLSSKSIQSSLNQLMEEHVVLLVESIKTTNNPAEYQANTKQLEMNSTAISEWIGQVYGEPAQYSFQTLWRAQINAYLQYTVETQAKSKDAAKELPIMTAFPANLTNWFVKINPKTHHDNLEPLLSSYVGITKTIIDSTAVSDFTNISRRQQDLSNTMTQIANLIYQDASIAYPDKLKTK